MAADGDGGLTPNDDASAALDALRRLEPRLSTRRVFVGLLLLVLATKWPVLRQPPVWDAAMSVFPAAITLAHLDFDVARLLEAPGYAFGGPNVHSLSVVTWGTALVYWIFGDRPGLVIPLLHLVHFLLAAWALTSLWRLAVRLLPDDGFPRVWALASCLCLAVCPLFFVQAGTMYLEIPMLAFAAAATVAWVDERLPRAAFWALLAALVKPPGLVVVGALAGSTLLVGGPWTRRLRQAAALLAAPSVYALVYTWKVPEYMAGFGSLGAQLDYASAIPDVMAILGAFCVMTLAFRPWRSAVSLSPSGDQAPSVLSSKDADAVRARAALVAAGMVASFAAFYLCLIPLGKAVNVLPRYFLLVLPFALLGVVAMATPRSKRGAAVLLALLTLFFLANRRGHFYPRPADNRFAVAERSMAYVELMELQNLGLGKLVQLGASDPVFYGLYDHYRLSYPAMGLGFETPPHGRYVLFEPSFRSFRTGGLEAFPPRFHMLYDVPWLGGELLMSVAWQAQVSPDRRVTTTQLQVGRFTSQIVHVEPAR